MAERKKLSKIPKQLEEVLLSKNISFDEPLIFAKADMTVDCEFKEQFLLLCKSSLIYGAAKNLMSERSLSGFTSKDPDYNDFEFKVFSVSALTLPAIDSLVVGGVFRVEIDGKAMPILAFTNSYKARINALKEVLEFLIKNEEPPEDKLFEEVREEFCPKCGTPYPDRERKVCPKCMDKRRIFFRLASYFAPHKFKIIAISIFCILGSFLTALWPTLSGSILYDEVLAKQKSSNILKMLPIEDFTVILLILAITMLAQKLLQQFFGIIQGRLVSKIVPNVVAELRKKVFASIQSLSVSFFTGRKTGGLMSRVTSDATAVSDIFIDGIPFILPNMFIIIFSCFFMFRANWLLAIVSIIALPPAMIISIKIGPILWHYNSKNFQTMRDLRSKLNDNLTGARVVRAFGKETNESKRLEKANLNVKTAHFKFARFDAGYIVIYAMANVLSTLFTWTIGACFVLAIFKPQMSYGTLITFAGYAALLAGPADFFSYIFRWWSGSMNAAQRIFEILDAKPEVVQSKNPIRIEELKGDLKLDNVSFGYEENREVLKNISIDIQAGKMLGIVGKSGAGKTTLANLITRLYDTTSGNIYLDEINIRDMAFEDIRKGIALVSQETYIFKGTIFENIAYANPSATKKDVLKAAVAASAHDFISKLPDGYDTYVGSGGRALSGGERQRISIARAILADPRILILDEATAAVDTETERNIQRSLKELIKNRTTLSIAHRLSTLRDADELIVLEDGKIIEKGTHDDLVRQKGAYYKLLQIQSKALAMRGIGD